MAPSLFQRFGRPLEIKLENSPGALSIVTQGNNNIIVVGRDALDAARSSHYHGDVLEEPITRTASEANRFC